MLAADPIARLINELASHGLEAKRASDLQPEAAAGVICGDVQIEGMKEMETANDEFRKRLADEMNEWADDADSKTYLVSAVYEWGIAPLRVLDKAGTYKYLEYLFTSKDIGMEVWVQSGKSSSSPLAIQVEGVDSLGYIDELQVFKLRDAVEAGVAMTTAQIVTLKGGPLDGQQVEVDNDYYLSPETDDNGRRALYQKFDEFEFVMMTEDYCPASAQAVLQELCPHEHTLYDLIQAIQIADLQWKLGQAKHGLRLRAAVRFAQSKIGQRVNVVLNGSTFQGGILTSQEFDTCTVERPGGLKMERVPVFAIRYFGSDNYPC